MNYKEFGTETEKKIVLGIIVISTFIALATTIIFVYAISSQGQEVPGILKHFIQHHIEFMAIMGVLGFLAGVFFYTILNSTIEKQKKIAKTNLNLLLKFLEKTDKEIVKLLVEKDGMTTQSEIAKINNMGRLKAHRAVRRLEERGIVHIEKYGKINIIRLTDELKQTK